MVVLWLAAVALPVALGIVLFGTLLAWISGDVVAGAATAIGQSIGVAWVTVTVVLVVFVRWAAAKAERASRFTADERPRWFGSRAWFLALPSVMVGARLVQTRLAGEFDALAVVAALIAAVVVTLVTLGVLLATDRRRASP